MDRHGNDIDPGHLSRRAWIAGALGTAAGAVVLHGCHFELRRLTVTRHKLHAPPRAERSFRAAQVSDLHIKEVGPREEAVFETLHEEAPDLTLLTGDIVDRERNLPLLDAFLRELPSGGRTLAILGNWERWSRLDIGILRDVYARHGCELLLNQTVPVDVGGTPLQVVGVDNSVNGSPDVLAALDGTPSNASRLFLAHCPAQRDEILSRLEGEGVRANGVLLSGHTHGGQVRVLGLAPALPRGSGPYVAGWYSAPGLDMYVSRGIGTSSFPIRIGAPPELALFEWG